MSLRCGGRRQPCGVLHAPCFRRSDTRALLTEQALAAAKENGLGFRVLIRPREGDFVYTPIERQAIVAEAEAVLSIGADKVVCGGLLANGSIDSGSAVGIGPGCWPGEGRVSPGVR